MNKQLPVYRLLIAEALEGVEEIEYISLVENPAIQTDFMTFQEQFPLVFSDDDKRIITGPAMLAGVPIYRRDDRLGEYYVVFDQENVLRAAQKFLQKGYANRVNLGHDRGQIPQGVFIFESWVTDRDRGVLPPAGYPDAPNGSWFVSAKVNDMETWKGVKAGLFKGFSVEGFFGVDLVPQAPAPAEDNLEGVLEQIKKILED